MVGPVVRTAGIYASKILPNLHTFVPARTLLLGQVPSAPVWTHVGQAMAVSGFYVIILVTASALAFQRRDFQ